MWPFKKRPVPELTRDELRDALFAAVGENNLKELRWLLRSYREQVFESFRVWSRVPEEFRANDEESRRWVETITAIAAYQEKLGDRRLVEMLMGQDKDNPIILWKDDLDESRWR